MSKQKQKGVVALVFTMTVLAIITIITLFTAGVITTDTRIFSNVQNNAQAYNAAQAGFQFALGFLDSTLLNQEAIISTNAVTTKPAGVVTTSLSGCTSASNTSTLSSGTLPNGATYTMTFGCITANDTNTLTLTAVGTSADGSSTRTVRATVQRIQASFIPLMSVGNVTVRGGGLVTNGITGATTAIRSGGTISIAGGGATVSTTSPAVTCTTTPCSIVTQNDPSLSGLTQSGLETAFMGYPLPGTTADTYWPSQADYVVTCTGNTSYNSSTDTLTNGNCSVTSVAPGVTPANPALNTLSRRTVYFTTSGGTNITLTFTTATINTATSPDIFIINRGGTGTLNVTFGNTLIFYGGIYTNANGGTGLRLTGNATTVNGVAFSSGLMIQNGGPDHNGVAIGFTSPTDINNSGTILQLRAVDQNNVRAGSVLGYAIVPGTWRDF